MHCPRGGEIVPIIANYSLSRSTNVYGEQESRFVYILIILVIIIFVILLIIALIIRIKDFSRQLRYINIELRRTSGVERQYWLIRRKALWKSLFFITFN